MSNRSFKEAKASVHNRGNAPDSFLWDMVDWARTAPEKIFSQNAAADIYSKIRDELGPWESLLHRRACMIEVLRVLAGFESSWDWKEGVDTSRLGATTPSNAEAGAWQISYDSRYQDAKLRDWLIAQEITDGIGFQQRTKFDHQFAMEYVARLLRITAMHNGPLYKGEERLAIRRSLRGEEHSIYPWLSRDAVREFQELLQA